MSFKNLPGFTPLDWTPDLALSSPDAGCDYVLRLGIDGSPPGAIGHLLSRLKQRVRPVLDLIIHANEGRGGSPVTIARYRGQEWDDLYSTEIPQPRGSRRNHPKDLNLFMFPEYSSEPRSTEGFTRKFSWTIAGPRVNVFAMVPNLGKHTKAPDRLYEIREGMLISLHVSADAHEEEDHARSFSAPEVIDFDHGIRVVLPQDTTTQRAYCPRDKVVVQRLVGPSIERLE